MNLRKRIRQLKFLLYVVTFVNIMGLSAVTIISFSYLKTESGITNRIFQAQSMQKNILQAHLLLSSLAEFKGDQPYKVWQAKLNLKNHLKQLSFGDEKLWKELTNPQHSQLSQKSLIQARQMLFNRQIDFLKATDELNSQARWLQRQLLWVSLAAFILSVILPAIIIFRIQSRIRKLTEKWRREMRQIAREIVALLNKESGNLNSYRLWLRCGLVVSAGLARLSQQPLYPILADVLSTIEDEISRNDQFDSQSKVWKQSA